MMRIISLVAAVLLVSSCAHAQTDGQVNGQADTQNPHRKPLDSAARANDALPHDGHEGLTVSADPYTDAERARAKFGKANPLPLGILPVEVFLRNDSLQPLRIDMSTIELTVHLSNGRQQDVDWLSIDDLADAVAHPKGPPGPKSPRFPIGVPSAADAKTERMKEILQPFALDAVVVPPMATIHGFLFFDLNHDISLADNSSLYVPNVTSVPSNKPLMFFDVPLNGGSPQ